jgi:hypothetical protein
MSSANKSVVLRGFNTYFFEFLDLVISYFPDRKELQTSKTAIELFKRANPTAIIKVWLSNVYTPYAAAINDGNIDFFVDKDYSSDLTNGGAGGGDLKKITEVIDNLREPVRLMTAEQRTVVINYIQNLSRMSVQYALS